MLQKRPSPPQPCKTGHAQTQPWGGQPALSLFRWELRLHPQGAWCPDGPVCAVGLTTVTSDPRAMTHNPVGLVSMAPVCSRGQGSEG